MLHYLRRAIPAYLSFSNWSHQFCEWMITGQLKCLEGHKSLHWRSKKNPCPQVLKQPLSSKSFYKVVLPFLLLLLLASVPQVSGRMVHWWSFTSLTTAKQQRPSSHSRSHAHSSSECFFPHWWFYQHPGASIVLIPGLKRLCPNRQTRRGSKHEETHKCTAEAPVMAATGQQMVVVCQHCCGKWICLGQSKWDCVLIPPFMW